MGDNEQWVIAGWPQTAETARGTQRPPPADPVTTPLSVALWIAPSQPDSDVWTGTQQVQHLHHHHRHGDGAHRPHLGYQRRWRCPRLSKALHLAAAWRRLLIGPGSCRCRHRGRCPRHDHHDHRCHGGRRPGARWCGMPGATWTGSPGGGQMAWHGVTRCPGSGEGRGQGTGHQRCCCCCHRDHCGC